MKTMISSGIGNLIHLVFILCLCNVILAVYEKPNVRRYPSIANNQRSAESGYRYAWFTRDIHDDDWMNNNNQEEEEISPQKLWRMKMLKSIFKNGKYPNSDEILIE